MAERDNDLNDPASSTARSQDGSGLWPRLCLVASLIALLFSCSDDQRFAPLGSSPVERSVHVDPCATPAEGCECNEENATAPCGEKVGKNADYVTCRLGVRVCRDGAWSDCKGSDLGSSSPQRLVMMARLERYFFSACPRSPNSQ